MISPQVTPSFHSLVLFCFLLLLVQVFVIFLFFGDCFLSVFFFSGRCFLFLFLLSSRAVITLLLFSFLVICCLRCYCFCCFYCYCYCEAVHDDTKVTGPNIVPPTQWPTPFPSILSSNHQKTCGTQNSIQKPRPTPFVPLVTA